MRPKLLLLDEPCKKAKKILEQEFELSSEWELPDMIYTQLTPVSSIVPVVCPCTGIEHVKAEEVIYLDDEWKRNEGRQVTSTAEHTWSLILQMAKMKRMQLSGKTIGVVGGMGRIGKQVIKYANAFDMRHIGCDLDAGYKIDIVLKDSDIVTLHVPLNESTKGMIGKREFELMKDGAILVNTSRAEIVDEWDLIDAIKAKSIYYADDFQTNHTSDLQYLIEKTGKGILTDHIGGNCIEAREATDIYIAKKSIEYWRSRTHDKDNS